MSITAPMTKRERELAQRHLDELIRMRDRTWSGMQLSEGSNRMLRYEALVYAIGLIEEALR